MKNAIVIFNKMYDDVKLPTKNEEDAAFDIYPRFEDDCMLIYPHEVAKIPTGIRSIFSSDYFIKLYGRGSTGSIGIIQQSGVIDSGYRGEWIVVVANHTDKLIIIAKDPSDTAVTKYLIDHGISQIKEMRIVYPYSKAITQAVVHKIPPVIAYEYPNDAFEEYCRENESIRGVNGFGSSGK